MIFRVTFNTPSHPIYNRYKINDLLKILKLMSQYDNIATSIQAIQRKSTCAYF